MKNKIITLRYKMSNCYVLCGEDQAILVDTSYKKQRNMILERLKDYNITLIILTHGHIDHIENAAFFAEKLGAKIAMHKNDYALSKDNTLHKIQAPSKLGKVIRFVSEKKMKSKAEPFEPEVFLEDGQSLLEYGIDANIVLLQGHTAGSIGIKSAGKSFIVGDTLMNFISPTASLMAEDFTKLEQSVQYLRESDAEVFYPGHGKPIIKGTF